MIDILSTLTLTSLLLAVAGMALGILFGALPGLGPSSSLALSLPLAMSMSPLNAMVFLINVYGGTQYGGGIPSILVGAPGDPSAAATCFDGFPMTRQGKVSEALAALAVSSSVGGVVSIIAFLLFSPMLARFALKFGAPEFFVLVLFALTMLVSVNPERMWKGLFAGALGLALSAVGVDPYWGQTRLTFGVLQLYEGIPFIPLLLGLFCISQMLHLVNDKSLVMDGATNAEEGKLTLRRVVGSMIGVFRHWRIMLQSSLVGLVIGAMPGAGSTIASFVAYNLARSTSKNPERYGTGISEGVIAPEAANNSSVGGALIPTFALGIPGSSSCAILLGAMMLLGLRPGPRLFIEQLPLMQVLCLFLLFGCVLMTVFGIIGAKYFLYITRIPIAVLIPCTIMLAVLGSYAERTESFDVGVMLVAGLVGFLLSRNNYPLSAVVLGFVLGPMAEQYFIQSVQMSNWDMTIFFTRPICIVFWILIVVSTVAARSLVRKNKVAGPPAGRA